MTSTVVDDPLANLSPKLLVLAAVLLIFVLGTDGFTSERVRNPRALKGHLYIVDVLSGNPERLARRHVEDQQKKTHKVRLVLRDAEGKVHSSLDMNLGQRSVWTRDSRLVVRDGENLQEVPLAVDPACFLSGRVASEEGVASFDKCEGLTGVVHTRNVNYLITSKEEAPLELETEFPEVDVTLEEPENIVQAFNLSDPLEEMEREESIFFGQNRTRRFENLQEREVVEAQLSCETIRLLSRVKREASENFPVSRGDIVSMRVKTLFSDIACKAGRTYSFTDHQAKASGGCRADFTICFDSSGGSGGSGGSGSGSTDSGSGSGSDYTIAAEIGVWVDNYMYNYLRGRGINTNSKITRFMITKWNTVGEVYGDVKRVGVAFAIQLKYVEVWTKNPSYYQPVQSSQSMSKHLSAFCGGTRGVKVDHRMLYTYGVGGNVLGLAYMHGICKTNSACSVSRSHKESVRVEIHEFGHSLGFKHEPDMQPCELPPGFMGWTDTYRFQDCYRRLLLDSLNWSSRQCLFRTNYNKASMT